jgi:phage terminase Nu1 subunit (DNA packaging protein)
MNVKIKDQTVNAVELSEWLGISPSAVSDNARRGYIHRAPTRGRYLLRDSIRSYAEHIRQAAAGREDDLTAKQRVRLLTAQADSAQGKATKLAGAYLDADDVKKTWAEIKRSGREILMTIPARAKARVPSLTAYDLAVIEEEVVLALRPFDDDDKAKAATGG